MTVKVFEVLNELGFHARVASRIVREARNFDSSIIVHRNGRAFDMKNVTGVIMTGAKNGDSVAIEFDGADEVEAASAFEDLFLSKFGEK